MKRIHFLPQIFILFFCCSHFSFAQINKPAVKSGHVFLNGIVGTNITKKVLLDSSTVITSDIAGSNGTICDIYFSGGGFSSPMKVNCSIGFGLLNKFWEGMLEKVIPGTYITIDPGPVTDKKTGKLISLQSIIYMVIEDPQ
jgi:hypothetical protein